MVFFRETAIFRDHEPSRPSRRPPRGQHPPDQPAGPPGAANPEPAARDHQTRTGPGPRQHRQERQGKNDASIAINVHVVPGSFGRNDLGVAMECDAEVAHLREPSAQSGRTERGPLWSWDLLPRPGGCRRRSRRRRDRGAGRCHGGCLCRSRCFRGGCHLSRLLLTRQLLCLLEQLLRLVRQLPCFGRELLGFGS